MSQTTKRTLQGILWITLYLALTLAPLFLLLVGPRPPGRGFWREFSVALGFAGLAMMCLQFVLTARFRWLKAPYGSDIVYFFHRQISLVAFVVVLAHPLILFIEDPARLGLLNLVAAPWRARFGVTAVLALIALVAISLWRQRLKIHYDAWRMGHGILATAAVALALGHIVLVGYYVAAPWKRVFWIAYSAFWVGLLAYVRVVKPWLELRRPYVVEEVRRERGDAWTLALRPEGHAGMTFHPGQFAWLTLRSSPFADREHPFSFSSSAARPERLEFTIKERGDFTRQIGQVRPGERAYLDGPHGAFTTDRHDHAAGFVFIAGGVGITPIMSMLRTLADRGDRRPLTLIYANRDWESVIFREEIAGLQASGRLNLRVVHVLERPPEGWDGERGYVTADILRRHLPPIERRNQYEVFICGPQPMMDAVERALVGLGVAMGDIHTERFDLV
ncbi:MAG: ferric reductase-like transmembrane domain-containing protein [Anaerolineae bacterium]